METGVGPVNAGGTPYLVSLLIGPKSSLAKVNKLVLHVVGFYKRVL